MLPKKALYLAAAALLLAPVAAFGQGGSFFQKDTKEFTIVGSGSSDDSFDNASFSTSFSYGQFFTDNLEGVIRQDVSFLDLPDGSDWSGSTRLVADYHFPMGNFVPLVGVAVGYVYGDNVEDQFIAGPEVGLKYFMNQTTFVFGLVEYQILFEDAGDLDDTYDDGRFVYGLGLGLTF